jgi:hypothetical protein
MWKNAAIRGAEAVETVSIMPVSLVAKAETGKILRKGMHLMMLQSTIQPLDGVGKDNG